jgi:hypothetical protein
MKFKIFKIPDYFVYNDHINFCMLHFFLEICPKFEDKNLTEMFSAEMEFCKIDPSCLGTYGCTQV